MGLEASKLLAVGEWINMYRNSFSSRTWTRANAVDSDAFPDLLIRQGPSKCDNSTLGRGIVKEVRTPNIGIDRRAIDYRRSPLHVREGVLGQMKEWMDVGVETVLPLGPISTVSIGLALAPMGCQTG